MLTICSPVDPVDPVDGMGIRASDFCLAECMGICSSACVMSVLSTLRAALVCRAPNHTYIADPGPVHFGTTHR